MDSEKFKCSVCSQFMIDPVTLPCGQNVCQSHSNLIRGFSFFCICNNYHLWFFTPNKTQKSELANVLKLDPQFAINEALKTIHKIESQDPEFFVYEYFEDVKRQVDLRRELLKNETDEHSNELIESIASKQSECMEMAKRRGPASQNFDGTVKEALKELIEKVQTVTVKADEFERVNRQILELKFQCDKLLEEYHREITKERYTLQPTDLKIADVFGTMEKRRVVNVKVSCLFIVNIILIVYFINSLSQF